MLITPKIDTIDDPILKILAEGQSLEPVRIAQGIYQIPHFNGCYSFLGVKDSYPIISTPENFEEPWLNCYGVCDSVENFLEVYAETLNKDPRRFVVTLTPVDRDPLNKGQGGGWRWHKWGPYIGAHEIQCEYLDDGEGIDRVYCFHIFEME